MTRETILIDDLRAPVLTPDQERLMREADENPVTLSEEAVLAEASRRVALDDFGPDDFRERLRLILSEVNESDNATGLVRATFFNRCAGVLANRLQAVDLLRRHPEIDDVEIDRPIVVAGLPRSGTTHMLGLLAADSRLRSLPYWESLQPIPRPGEAAGPDGIDPRYTRAQAAWERLQRVNPMMAPYHPMDPDHIHEDLELMVPDLASYIWEGMYRMPRWRDHYLAHDQTPHYAYGRTMLKVMTWQDGVRKRWVIKCPQHFEQLGPLLSVYPDAFVVFVHRDPVESLQSIVTQIAYVIRTRERVPDPDYYAAYWIDRVDRLLSAFVRDVRLVPEEQRIDIRFDDLLADDMHVIGRICEAADHPLTDAARGEILAYRDDHRRGKHGAIDHDLKRDFDLDPDELRERFAYYFGALEGA